MQNTDLWFRAELRSCRVPVLSASVDLGWFLSFLIAPWMSITRTCCGPKFFQVLAKCVIFMLHLSESI